MIITDTETNETLKPPILHLPLTRSISRPPSPAPPPLHPTIHYGLNSPVTPPGYANTTRPTGPITYLFEPRNGENAMLLRSAPTNGCEARHPYHISVNLNCFTPSSHITSIRKHGSDGELVGDFEIGAKDSKNDTVFLRANEHPVEDVLISSTRLFRSHWTWKPLDAHCILHWDDSPGGNTIACFMSKDRTNENLLAKFIPKSHKRRAGRQPEYTKLEVTQNGHEFFEDILISALIIERLRTNV